MLISQHNHSRVLEKVPMLENAARNLNLALWGLLGRSVPPPSLFKARTVRKYARRYGLSCLVETGTFRGGMIAALKRDFDEIYSIELSPELHAAARLRFNKDKHIELICGDSGDELPRLVERLARESLFWLDAHYSGGVTARGIKDTPIMKEIACILRDAKAHVILVDDMRLFGTDPAYPTSEALIAKIEELAGERVRVEVRDDILRIAPLRAAWGKGRQTSG
jgi:hypothetical protein